MEVSKADEIPDPSYSAPPLRIVLLVTVHLMIATMSATVGLVDLASNLSLNSSLSQYFCHHRWQPYFESVFNSSTAIGAENGTRLALSKT
jgi:hypothetical protein